MTHFEIRRWLNTYNIAHCHIHENGIVDVNGDVYLNAKNLIEIPIQFGTVVGSFHIDQNNLTSMKGFPSVIGGSCYAYRNKLTTLEGGPISVGANFDISSNNLTSLQHGPKTTDHYVCSGNDQLYEVLPHLFACGYITKRFSRGDEGVDEIINKYLPSKDILSCVDELIESGYYVYTKGV